MASPSVIRALVPIDRQRLAVGLIALTSIVLVLWAAYGSRGLGIERVTALVAAGVAFAMTFRWRSGVYIVLAYVTIEGAVSNFLYPALYPLLIKDALIAGAYAGFLGSVILGHEEWTVRADVIRPFLVLAALVAAGALNPHGVPPLVGLIGARVLLFYIPLYVLGYSMARDPGALPRLVRFVLVTSIPITLIGIWQYQAGPEAVASLGEGFARTVWFVGPESTREFIYKPVSTFAFVGHFGAYLFFIPTVALGALHTPRWGGGRILTAAAFWSAVIAVVLHSSRTTWVLLPLAAAGTYLLNWRSRGAARALPMLAVGVLLAVTLGGPVLENRLPALTPGSGVYTDRVRPLGVNFLRGLFTPEALIGHGTGTALGAARHASGGEVSEYFEMGWFIPFYMFGIWGVLVYVWLYAAVLRGVWRGVQTFSAGDRWVPAALLLYMLFTAAISGPLNYPPTNVLFWIFAGLLAGAARAAPRPANGADAAPASFPVRSAP